MTHLFPYALQVHLKFKIKIFELEINDHKTHYYKYLLMILKKK